MIPMLSLFISEGCVLCFARSTNAFHLFTDPSLSLLKYFVPDHVFPFHFEKFYSHIDIWLFLLPIFLSFAIVWLECLAHLRKCKGSTVSLLNVRVYQVPELHWTFKSYYFQLLSLFHTITLY